MPRSQPFNDSEQSNVVDSINHMFLEIERLRLEQERLQQEVITSKDRADYYQRQVEQIHAVLDTPIKVEGTAMDERKDSSSPRRMRFVSRAKKRMDKSPKSEGIFARLQSTNAADSPTHRGSDIQKKQ